MDVVKMYKDLNAEWVKRLRSGEYTQGTGALKKVATLLDDVEHCCLGVLCEVAVDAGIITEDEGKMDMGRLVTFDGCGSFLPEKVSRWAGLTGPCGGPAFWGIEDRDGETISLVGMNDSGFTFSQIADMIEWGL